jgi:hypothetical protein
VAHALSHRAHPESSLQLISSMTLDWLVSVQSSYETDPYASELLAKMTLKGDYVPNYTLKDGIIRYKSRIWIKQAS